MPLHRMTYLRRSLDLTQAGRAAFTWMNEGMGILLRRYSSCWFTSSSSSSGSMAKAPSLTKFCLVSPSQMDETTKLVSELAQVADRERTLMKECGNLLLHASSLEALLEFDNGKSFHLSAEFLRVQSPAADSKRRTVSGEKVIAGRRNVGIMSVEKVGNYGLRISFDDLHNTGIYSWDYLYNLGEKKFTLMREYLNTLKKHNLSRSPPGKK